MCVCMCVCVCACVQWHNCHWSRQGSFPTTFRNGSKLKIIIQWQLQQPTSVLTTSQVESVYLKSAALTNFTIWSTWVYTQLVSQVSTVASQTLGVVHTQLSRLGTWPHSQAFQSGNEASYSRLCLHPFILTILVTPLVCVHLCVCMCVCLESLPNKEGGMKRVHCTMSQ